MKEYTYPVLAFRQQEEAPIQVAFVAPTGELMEWAGVPRKSDELLTGYQRFRDDTRINQEIVPFFQDPHNCSPTAIILALRKTSGLGSCQLERTDVPVGQIIETCLKVQFKIEDLNTRAMFEAALEYVDSRLHKTSGAAVVTPNGDSDVEDDDIVDEEDDEDAAETEDDNVEIAHLGTATLNRMKEYLQDEDNWSRREFQKAIADYVKPASIIDGQHRAAAAAKIGSNGLPFIVCGLYDAPWEEQVFQFTVVNLKPRRIPPSVITSIAGLSLTREEQDKVERRLKQAGIRMAEVTIMSLVAYDDRSPFAGKVDMHVSGPKDREEKLGYGSMKRIAKDWYAATRTALTLIAKEAYATNNTSRARHLWRAEKAWFEFFCSFWDAVRAHYPEAIWEKSPSNRLFIGANLWALQEVILKQADNQIPSVWHIRDKTDSIVDTVEERIELLKGKLLEVVNNTLPYFPAEMWTIPWAKVSQDTNAGREELVKLFNQFIDEGKKGGFWKNWKKSEWFKTSNP